MFTPVHVVRDFYDHLARGDFANIWTVRANKLQTFHMHTDTAKVLEAMST